jgi:hypothetical protein
MEKTAVNWLIEQIFFSDQREKFEKYINQALEMEKEQAHEYAEFAIRCDRKEMKILNFDGFIKLKSE